MSNSVQQPLPKWMVRNGETWTIVDFADCVVGHPDVRYANVSRFGEARREQDILLVLGVRDFRVVDRDGSGGWASIACGSESSGWVNLVVEDGPSLARALELADHRFRDYPTVEEIMTARPLAGSDAETFSELFSRFVTLDTDSSTSTPLTELETATTLWETIFESFQLGIGDAPHELSMLMYADNRCTMRLLENGQYLPHRDGIEQVNREDLRLASCLRRLRRMTTWASRGFDIDKRCHGAIDMHVNLRPALRDFYREALSD
ncbi:MAG: hypothetical protein FJ267_20580 [Planctomycetes bacterium]|nr:hypothetical protein [Planctomycetota bacterium]